MHAVITILTALHKAIKQKINNLVVSLHSQFLLLAGQAPVGGHLYNLLKWPLELFS